MEGQLEVVCLEGQMEVVWYQDVPDYSVEVVESGIEQEACWVDVVR